MKKYSEHDLQVSVFKWFSLVRQTYQGIESAYAIPNGGHRDVRVAVRLKAEGVKSGVPDICIPVAREQLHCYNGLCGYKQLHGMYIELKIGKNKMTPAQEEYARILKAGSYHHVVCYSLDEVMSQVEKYFTGHALT